MIYRHHTPFPAVPIFFHPPLAGFHKEFPRLFQPAFTLYLNMTRWVMGERFWSAKKDEIRKIKETERKKVSC
jgi:hypothetical protein